MLSDDRFLNGFAQRKVDHDLRDQTAQIEPAARRQRCLMPAAVALGHLARALVDDAVVATRTARKAKSPPSHAVKLL